MAGLGGDSRFIKTDMSARWYYPLLKDPKWGGAYVLALGGSLGYGSALTVTRLNNDLPLFERYFLGGINSIRGFQRTKYWRRAHRRTAMQMATTVPVPRLPAVIKRWCSMPRSCFPCMEQYGLRGVAFFDVGNSFNSFELR